jgi:hypothetical protein
MANLHATLSFKLSGNRPLWPRILSADLFFFNFFFFSFLRDKGISLGRRHLQKEITKESRKAKKT